MRNSEDVDRGINQSLYRHWQWRVLHKSEIDERIISSCALPAANGWSEGWVEQKNSTESLVISLLDYNVNTPSSSYIHGKSADVVNITDSCRRRRRCKNSRTSGWSPEDFPMAIFHSARERTSSEAGRMEPRRHLHVGENRFFKSVALAPSSLPLPHLASGRIVRISVRPRLRLARRMNFANWISWCWQ